MSEMIHLLTVIHLPEVGDESHAGIGGYANDDLGLLVADLLAENVKSDMLLKPATPLLNTMVGFGNFRNDVKL